MKPDVILKVSLNVALVAAFYIMVGGLISIIVYNLFEEPDDEWKKQHILYKLLDIFLELAIICISAFWITYVVRYNPPLFKISKNLDVLIDTYVSGLIFSYGMFIFLDSFFDKIRHVYKEHLLSMLNFKFA